MRDDVAMRYLMLLVLVLVLLSCTPQEPTPTEPPTLTEKERDLPIAQGVAAQFSSLTSAAQRDLPRIGRTGWARVHGYGMPGLQPGSLRPDLYPLALTEDGDLYFAIKDYSVTKPGREMRFV